ncbi:MAG TPA: GatB/YqeY domain-containing protein [Rhizobiaceae bacterium]|nr:GatB/YqeY domain-containing protein [Rhizobiaceae bacterium]
MALRDTIEEALKTALKAKAADDVSALRMVRAAIQQRDIENRGTGKPAATDEEVLQVMAKMVKQREESAAAFDAGKRPELAARERGEIALIRRFMPKQMDEAETRAAAEAAVRETGAASMKDMGKVIARLREKHAGQMDFAKASAIVKNLLG